jgi:molecular chaperone GrpE
MDTGHRNDGPERRAEAAPERRAGSEPERLTETEPEPGIEGGPEPGIEGGPERRAQDQEADVAQLAQLKARAADLEDRWRRAVADLDNLRKRVARDVAAQRAEERVQVAAELLPVLDNLDLALAHAEADPGGIVEGVRAVRDQAVGVLTRLGFPRQDEVGVPFHPARHEAVSVTAGSDAPDGTVVQVLRPGYGDADHLLRPAAVVVAKKAD